MSSAELGRPLANELEQEIERLRGNVSKLRNLLVVCLGLLGFSCAVAATLLTDTFRLVTYVGPGVQYSYWATSASLLGLLAAELSASISWNDCSLLVFETRTVEPID